MPDESKKSAWPVLKRLFSFIKPHKFWFFLRIGASVVKAASDVFFAYFVLLLVNSALAGNHPELLKAVCWMLGFVTLGKALGTAWHGGALPPPLQDGVRRG